MKKFLIFGGLGFAILLGGCSSIEKKDLYCELVNTGQTTQLGQQLNGLKDQISGLVIENDNFKNILSGALLSIQILQEENVGLKITIDKYKKIIVDNKLSNKVNTDTKILDKTINNNITYTDSKYGLSFDYNKNRKIDIKEENMDGAPVGCSLKLNISLVDPSKPLNCFEAGFTPTIESKLGIGLWTISDCQRVHSMCNDVPSNTKDICNQLKKLGVAEASAAKTSSFLGGNGSDYNIIKSKNGYMIKGYFTDGVVRHAKAFLVEKDGYILQIDDIDGKYNDMFDNLIKSFKY